MLKNSDFLLLCFHTLHEKQKSISQQIFPDCAQFQIASTIDIANVLIYIYKSSSNNTLKWSDIISFPFI